MHFEIICRFLNAKKEIELKTLKSHFYWVGFEFTYPHLNMVEISTQSFKEENDWVKDFFNRHKL